MLKGIDISYCQAGLSIPDTGADFCFIKATEGLGIVDNYCDGFVQQCIALGKPWGFYHFARPNGGAAEARYGFCCIFVGIKFSGYFQNYRQK